MLNPDMGKVARIGGHEFLVTEPNRIGHALYGPYAMVSPGRWVVEFVLCMADENSDPTASITIDVAGDNGKTLVAIDFIAAADLTSKPRIIPLAFEIAEARILEFRVHIDGRAPLLVADNPVLRPRQANEDVADRTLDRNGTTLYRLSESGVRVRSARDEVTITMKRTQADDLLGWTFDTDDGLARRIAERVAFRGDPENALYRAFIGRNTPMASPPRPVPFSSSLCQQAHFGLDQYRFWASALKDVPKFIRKQWEWVYIAQALFERSLIAQGKRGLAFGAGLEPLPALFASFGVSVVATDQSADDAERSGWTASRQHTFDVAALNERGICTDRMFRELVSFQPVDMNAIPAKLNGQFDFCWSSCSLEHLGSLEHGLAFIENAMQTLRPGGVAVHTTEFNLSSDSDTLESPECSFYRRRDIEALADRLKEKGYALSPLDWSLGEGFAERVVDLPPFGRGEPHIRLKSQNYDVTSIGLIISRPGGKDTSKRRAWGPASLVRSR